MSLDRPAAPGEPRSGLVEEAAQLRALLDQPPVETRRPTVDSLEERLFKPVPVLDHGFVRVVDYMGDDAAVVQAARVSYGKGTRRVSEDAGLINYLLRHRHTTPFEMCEIKYHVKLPIFVARQWIRHRTANVNEYSARYSILDNEFYLPAPEHLGVQSSANRQGRGDVAEVVSSRQRQLETTDPLATLVELGGGSIPTLLQGDQRVVRSGRVLGGPPGVRVEVAPEVRAVPVGQEPL